MKSKYYYYILLVFESVSSTMDIAKQRLQENIDILAFNQTNGRGKPGNTWHSHRDNFLLSMNMDVPNNKSKIWHDSQKNSAQYMREALAVYFGVLIGLTIQSLKELSIQYKFPNDIYLEGKKLGGILIEIYDERMIVGIGVNLKTSQDEFANLKAYDIEIKPLDFYHIFKQMQMQYSFNAKVLEEFYILWRKSEYMKNV